MYSEIRLKTYVFRRIVVALSDLDSNKYHAVVRFKQSITIEPESMASREGLEVAPRKVNEYNEVVACVLKQDHKHLSKEEISALVADYRNGKTTYELAEKYGCNRHTISHHLEKQGVQVTITCTVIAESIPQIVALYDDGMKIIEIAAQYGVSTATINKYLHIGGAKIRSRWDY